MTKVRTFFVQWSQYYDTHDELGNLRNPDSSYFKTIQDALDLDNWLNWRKKWLAEKIVQTLPAKGQRKKGQRKGTYIGICHYADTKINTKTKKREHKENHIHTCVSFANAVEVEKAREFFEVSRKQNCMPVKNVKNVLEYMLHITAQAIQDHKHIYSEDELFSNFADQQEMLDYFHKKISSTAVKDTKIDEDDLTNITGWYIQQGKLNLDGARRIFQKAYEEKSTIYFNRAKKALETAFQSYLDEKSNDFKINNRDLTTIFITGLGGVGKSALASAMAYNASSLRTWHDAPPTGKNKTIDIADGYKGEDVAIFNEFDGNSEGFRAFCSIFDPHVYSSISSRNKNKNMLITKAFITTSQTPLEFVASAIYQGQNDKDVRENIISNPLIKNIHDLINLSSLIDIGCEDDLNHKKTILNVAHVDGYQVARRLGGIIEAKRPNTFPYVPTSTSFGVSQDIDDFFKEFEIVNAKDFEFSKPFWQKQKRSAFDTATRKYSAILTPNATTADTSYTLYKWDDNLHDYLRGATIFVHDVTDHDLMRKIGLAIDMIYKIAETNDAVNYENEILEKAMNN